MPKTTLLDLAKRLADYVRMTIEIGGLKPDSPIGIAYRDFMEEWPKHEQGRAGDGESRTNKEG